MIRIFLILFLFCPSAHAGQMLSTMPGLVALFHANEGSGTSISNSISTDAVVLSGAWTTGRFGSAYRLNGTTSNIARFSKHSLFNYAYPTEVSVVLWYKPAIYTNFEQALFWHAKMGRMVFDIEADNRFRFGYQTSSGWNLAYTAKLASQYVGKWVHLAAVIKVNSYVDIYVDGVRDAHLTTIVGTSMYDVGDKLPTIGGDTNSGTPGCCVPNGTSDEVGIFSRALTAGEIQAIVSDGRANHVNYER